MNIEEDPLMIEFLNNRQRKKHTKSTYTRRLLQYCRYTGLTPTELIDEAEDEEDKRIRMRKRKIKKHVHGFISKMHEENKSSNYIRGTLTTIRTFYRTFDIELPETRYNISEEQLLITATDIPTKEDIKKALKYANIKYKAIIHVMMSSGMGSSEIRHLTLKDYLDSLKITKYDLKDMDELIQKLREKEKDIPTWSIRRYKTGMPYITFSSPESVRAINNYIEERYEKSYSFKSIEDCLFVNIGKHMNRRSFVAYFSRLNDSCGFGFFKRQRFFTSHALRKFFATTLTNNGIDYLTAEWLIGHKVKRITDAYIKPDIYRLKNDYLDVLPLLSIEDVETLTIEGPEYKKLNEQLLSKDEEIQELKDKLDQDRKDMEKKLAEFQEQIYRKMAKNNML